MTVILLWVYHPSKLGEGWKAYILHSTMEILIESYLFSFLKNIRDQYRSYKEYEVNTI